MQGFSDKAELSISYIPSYAVVRIFKHNRLVLSRKILSFTVAPAVDNKYLNLGLYLKTKAERLKVLGYFSGRETRWQFAEKVPDFVKEYIALSLGPSE